MWYKYYAVLQYSTYAECPYAESRSIAFILSVIVLSVVAPFSEYVPGI